MKAAEIKIHFNKKTDNGFFSELRNEVNKVVSAAEQTPDYGPAKKAAVLSALYIASCVCLYSTRQPLVIYLAYILAGTLVTLIVLNIVHEASHGSLFRNKTLNKLALLWMAAFGTDGNLWKKRHVISHHSYPNIFGRDVDIPPNGIIRLHPQTPFRKIYTYQPYYTLFFYFLFSLNWFIIRDFRDAFVDHQTWKITRLQAVKLIVYKIFFLSYALIIPAMLHPSLTVYFVTGFLVMHFTVSITAVMALGTAHVNDDSVFPQPDENGLMPDSWAKHQIITTQDFATSSNIANYIFGGFNFHIVHHLFPELPCRYYPAISKIVRQKAREAGIPYKSKSLAAALTGHCRLILKNARLDVDM